MIPAIFGSAVYQFNGYIGMLLASTLREGSISWLYYADRLVQFPLGVFGIALSTATLPTLSAQVAGNHTKAFNDTLSHSLRMVLFITIPAMAGLIVLGEPIIRIIFERGKFDAFSTSMTQLALIYYTVGLWAYSGIRIVVVAFYAHQDMKTPVKVAFITAFFNIFFSLILMRFLQHGGLALALSLSSSIQFCLLVLLIKRRLPDWDLRPVISSTFKSLAASVVMGAVIYIFNDLWLNSFWTSAGLLWQILVLGLLVGAGILRSPELRDFIKLMKPASKN